MTNEEVREALRLLLQVWEQGGREACEALLNEVEAAHAAMQVLLGEVEGAAEEVEDHLLWRECVA